MSEPKFCKGCQHWMSMEHEMNKPFGICDHPTVDGKILVDREQSIYEDNTAIYTEQNFGCIYHTPRHGNVTAKI